MPAKCFIAAWRIFTVASIWPAYRPSSIQRRSGTGGPDHTGEPALLRLAPVPGAFKRPHQRTAFMRLHFRYVIFPINPCIFAYFFNSNRSLFYLSIDQSIHRRLIHLTTLLTEPFYESRLRLEFKLIHPGLHRFSQLFSFQNHALLGCISALLCKASIMLRNLVGLSYRATPRSRWCALGQARRAHGERNLSLL